MLVFFYFLKLVSIVAQNADLESAKVATYSNLLVESIGISVRSRLCLAGLSSAKKECIHIFSLKGLACRSYKIRIFILQLSPLDTNRVSLLYSLSDRVSLPHLIRIKRVSH